MPFPNFAEGPRGFALLWLRLAAAVVLARDAADAFPHDSEISWLLLGPAALFVAAGFLTPAWALLTTVAELVRLSIHRSEEWRGSFLVASILIALTVLGPGAYSIDRWLFGRKRLTIGRPPN